MSEMDRRSFLKIAAGVLVVPSLGIPLPSPAPGPEVVPLLLADEVLVKGEIDTFLGFQWYTTPDLGPGEILVRTNRVLKPWANEPVPRRRRG